MKENELYPQDIQDFADGDHISARNVLLEGTIMKATEKAILVEFLSGQHVRTHIKKWIPKSMLTIIGGLELHGEAACETPYSRQLDVVLKEWFYRKNFQRG